MSKRKSFRFNVVNAIASYFMALTAPPGSLSSLQPEERNVVLIWNALGLIEDVGLREFFQAGHDIDKLVQTFSIVGFDEIANCLREASLIISDSKQDKQHMVDKIEATIYSQEDDIEQGLFKYISTVVFPEP
jgi:hypothetical protein